MGYRVLDITSRWTATKRITILLIDPVTDIPVGTAIVDYGGTQNATGDAILWNLQIARKVRHLGIGHELLHLAINNALQHKCKTISLEWNPIDSEGWVFDWYKRNGFEVDGNGRYGIVRMTKQLKKGGNDDCNEHCTGTASA